MTDTQKKTASWSLAGGLVVLAAIGTGWGHIEPLLSWAFNNLGLILEREQVQAVLASLAGGVLLGAWLPHVLPTRWSPAKTQVVTGIACSLFTLVIAATLVSTRTGVVYAVLAAVATPTVSRAIAGLIYVLKPAAKPESLQP